MNEILDDLMGRLQELQASLPPVPPTVPGTSVNGGGSASHLCKCGGGASSSPLLLQWWGNGGEVDGLMNEAGMGKGFGGGRQPISVGEELERVRDTQRQLLVKVRGAHIGTMRLYQGNRVGVF